VRYRRHISDPDDREKNKKRTSSFGLAIFGGTRPPKARRATVPCMAKERRVGSSRIPRDSSRRGKCSISSQYCNIRLLVYVWGDGERIKFFKLIKREKRGEKRGKIRDLFTTISEGISCCGRRECEERLCRGNDIKMMRKLAG
jgi:hypothetical protein